MPKRRADEPLADPVLVTVDPGGTTGLSVFQVHPECLVTDAVPILTNVLHWWHGEISGPENEQVRFILRVLEDWPGCALLVEDFILRIKSMDRELLSPVRIRAKLDYALELEGRPGYFSQAGELAMDTATNERLKRWGFYQREGGLEHARDADRHALTWLRECKKHAWLRAKCWPYIYGPGGEFGPAITA